MLLRAVTGAELFGRAVRPRKDARPITGKSVISQPSMSLWAPTAQSLVCALTVDSTRSRGGINDKLVSGVIDRLREFRRIPPFAILSEWHLKSADSTISERPNVPDTLA